MSVSSHISPEPERRLWIMHGNMRRAAGRADIKLGAIAFFSLFEAALLRADAAGSPLALAALMTLCLVLPLCILGVSPFIETPGPLPLLDRMPKPAKGDAFVAPYDLAKYSSLELPIILDRYLGGGVTAPTYHEDIVGQVVLGARMTVRKERLLGAACALALPAQALIAVLFFLRRLF